MPKIVDSIFVAIRKFVIVNGVYRWCDGMKAFRSIIKDGETYEKMGIIIVSNDHWRMCGSITSNATMESHNYKEITKILGVPYAKTFIGDY